MGNDGHSGGGGVGIASSNVDIRINYTPVPSDVNQAPVNSIPGSQTVAVNGSLVFSAHNTTPNGIFVSDPDAGTSDIGVTLVATNGSITLSHTDGLFFGEGDGLNDGKMAFRGSIPSINAALEGMTFNPATDFISGSGQVAAVDIYTGDYGFTGTGHGKMDYDRVLITVNGSPNHFPVNTVPTPTAPFTSLNTPEGVSITFSSANNNAISILDVDAGAADVGVRLMAAHGTLSLGPTSGLTSVDGNGTESILVVGSQQIINIALNGLTFTPTEGYSGWADVMIATTDNGHAGIGGALVDIDKVDIMVGSPGDVPWNAAPSITAPSFATTHDGQALVFNNGAISISDSLFYLNATLSPDPDTGSTNLAVKLVAHNGTLTLNGNEGLTLINGDGADDSSVSFRGTAAAINAALNGLTFQPDPNYSGGARIDIMVNDMGNTGIGGPYMPTRSIPLWVYADNDAPSLTVPGSHVVNEDMNLSISGISVSDVDAGTSDVQVNLSVGHGLLSVPTTGLTFLPGDGDGTQDPSMTFTGNLTNVNNALGHLVYRSSQDYNGNDHITIAVDDLAHSGVPYTHLTDTKIINVTVSAVNDNPTAANDTATVLEDSVSNVVNVLTNDTFAPDTGETLTVTDANAVYGTVSINPDDTLSYTPFANYNGTDTITYTISDGNEGTATSQVNVTVTSVNDLPTANTDSATVDEDSVSNLINVLANDTFAPDTGETLTVNSAEALNGTVLINPDGTLNYTPSGNYNGPDTITYTISDGNEGAATSQVNVTVTSVNDAPVSTSETYTSSEDTPLVVPLATGVLLNDTDDEGNPLTAVLVTGPSNGTLMLNADGSFTYTPDTDFTGEDSFTYKAYDGSADGNTATVSIMINAAPEIVSPISLETSEDTFKILDGTNAIVISDAENDLVTVTLTAGYGKLSSGAYSDATLILMGTPTQVNNSLNGIIYTPNENFNGQDTISVVVWEFMTPSPLGATSDIVMNVTPVNDAPVVTAPSSIITLEGRAMSLTGENAVVVTDVEQDAVSVTLTVDYGTLLAGESTGATITLSGSPTDVNTTLSGLTYTPDTNYNGADTISVTVIETSTLDSLQTSASIGVTIRSVDNSPVLNAPLSVTIDEDTSISLNGINGITVSDVDNDIVRVTLTVNHGILTDGHSTGSTITLTGTPTEMAVALNSIIYTATANYNGEATILINVQETSTVEALSATSAVNVHVTPVNDAPVIHILDSLPSSATAGTDLDLRGVFRVEDVDGDNLTFQLTALSNGLPVDTLNIDSGGGSAEITRDSNNPNSLISVIGSPEAINMALSNLSESLPPSFTGNIYFSSNVSDGIAPLVNSETSPGLTVYPPVVVDNTQVINNYVAPTIAPQPQSVTITLVDAPLSSSGTVTETNTSVQLLSIEVKITQSAPESTTGQPANVAAVAAAAERVIQEQQAAEQKVVEQVTEQKAVEQQKVVEQYQLEKQQAAEQQKVVEQAEQTKSEAKAEAKEKAVEKAVEKTGSEHAATLVGVQVAVVSTGGHTMIVVYNPATVAAASGGLVGTTTQLDLGTAQTMSVGSFTQYLAEAAKAAAASSKGFSAFELPPGITISDVKRSCNECTQNLSFK
jgi:hypothetical protein